MAALCYVQEFQFDSDVDFLKARVGKRVRQWVELVAECREPAGGLTNLLYGGRIYEMPQEN